MGMGNMLSGDDSRSANAKQAADSWCQRNLKCRNGRDYFGVAYAKTVKDPRQMTSADCGCQPIVERGVNVRDTGRNPTYGNIIPEKVGMNGLSESFIESLGSIGNLAIVGLAIYGGFCLAKKV
jgi:hypothetical protein